MGSEEVGHNFLGMAGEGGVSQDSGVVPGYCVDNCTPDELVCW